MERLIMVQRITLVLVLLAGVGSYACAQTAPEGMEAFRQTAYEYMSGAIHEATVTVNHHHAERDGGHYTYFIREVVDHANNYWLYTRWQRETSAGHSRRDSRIDRWVHYAILGNLVLHVESVYDDEGRFRVQDGDMVPYRDSRHGGPIASSLLRVLFGGLVHPVHGPVRIVMPAQKEFRTVQVNEERILLQRVLNQQVLRILLLRKAGGTWVLEQDEHHSALERTRYT